MFEQRVTDAYRALGYHATHNTQIAGKQTDILARLEVEGAPGIALAVECKDTKSPIGNNIVAQFVTRVIAQRDTGLITGGVLVSARGFTAPAKQVASAHRFISLLSWDELASTVLNVRNQLADSIAEYEESSVSGQYLPLGVEVLSWENLAPIEGKPRSTPEVLDEWMEHARCPEQHAGILVILADFGAGKSTLLHHFHYERAKAYLAREEARVPLFVPLRQFRETQDVTTMVRASFREAYHRDLSSDLLWQRIESGGLYLLLDGFDEMAERSDAARRLELFSMLVPLLRSASPAILTSRPSHFVQPGELNRLLVTFANSEVSIASGRPHSTVDELRSSLVERFRETRPGRTGNVRLISQSVRVGRLLPFDRRQIIDFVYARACELETAGYPPEVVMDFIDRTYDLTDLASRPMLLGFIVESIVKRRLDPTDVETRLGVSGIYEAYTDVKLELDDAKRRTRMGGLSIDSWRLLAEQLAVLMYTEGVIEMNFIEAISAVRARCKPLDQEVARLGLSAEEVATDFATCSFVTLTRDGQCRFVHKSFRGFFLARVLKDALRSRDPLLAEPLEQEVLYFLGGFAPQQGDVGRGLRRAFVRAKSGPRRRNLFVAYLYTQPRHERLQAREVEISEVGFGSLTFVASRFEDVSWRECTIRELDITDSSWRAIVLCSSRVRFLTTQSSQIDLSLVATTVESWRAERLWAGECSVAASSIEQLTLCESQIRFVGEPAIGKSVMDKSHTEMQEAVVTAEEVEITDSRLHLRKARINQLRAHRSMITLDGPPGAFGRSVFAHSLVCVSGGSADVIARGMRTDRITVLLCSASVTAEPLARISGGLFGEWTPATPLKGRPKAWGIVRAASLLAARSIPSRSPGCRMGDLIVVSDKWYRTETGPRGRLTLLGRLGEAAARSGAVTDTHINELAVLLAETRRLWEEIAADDWPESDH